jgi:hypothetical protein
LNITDKRCPNGYIEPIDFIQETDISIDILQKMIKYHRLDGYYDNNERIYFIKRYEVDYFKEYFKSHIDIL